MNIPCDGLLWLDGWHGRTSKRVRIVSETSERYRIKAITRTKLAGRNRYLHPGETALVPKYAVDEVLD